MADVQFPLQQPRNMTNNRYPPKNILEIRGYSGAPPGQLKFMKKKSASFRVNPDSILHINRNHVDTLVDIIEYIPNNSLNEESNEGWTSTGVMSDSSSVYSIDDGDFDKEASKKVNNQLKEIEAILYEQNSSYRPIQIECKEWIEKFPHLRLLGSQITSVPKEEGFNYVENRQNNQSQLDIYNLDPTQLDLLDTPKGPNVVDDETMYNKYSRRADVNYSSSSQGISVNGTGLLPIYIDVEENAQLSTEYKFLEEETFEEEGSYEELLAYDNREDEYALEHKRLNINKRRRRNLPPISPKAAVKDLVLNLLFDIVWSEIITWSSDTIRRYARSISTNLEFSEQPQSQQQQQQQQQQQSSYSNNPLSKLNSNMLNIPTMPNVYSNNSINQRADSAINNNNHHHSHGLNQSQNQLSYSKSHNLQQLKNSYTYDSSADGLLSIQPLKETNMYLQTSMSTNKNSRNYNNENMIDRSALNSTLDHISDQISGLDNFLQIKPFKNGSGNTNKLASVVQNARIGSAVRKQYSLKKRLQNEGLYPPKSSLDTIHDNKNIIIHGAAVGKPHTNLNTSVSENVIGNNRITHNPTPLHHTDYADDFDDEENEYYDHSILAITNRQANENELNDEIGGMINYNVTGSSKQKHLPPIEKILTHKAIAHGYRISSANNSKKRPESIDRPMTTTATRYEISLPVATKRAPTPSNHHKNNSLANLLNNIQITGTGVNRLNNDETSVPLQIHQANSNNKSYISQFRKKYK